MNKIKNKFNGLTPKQKIITITVIIIGILAFCGSITPPASNTNKNNNDRTTETTSSQTPYNSKRDIITPTPTDEILTSTTTPIEAIEQTLIITPEPSFKISANDFYNIKVEDLLLKYSGSYIKEEKLPMASQFYIKNENINLSASYKSDSRVINKFTAELLKFECKVGQEYSINNINKYLNFFSLAPVESTKIKFNDTSEVTSIEDIDNWKSITFNCFEENKIDITFIGKNN